MKIPLALLVAALTFYSCRKDWQCDCTQTVQGQSTVYTKPYHDTKESVAEEDCKAWEIVFKQSLDSIPTSDKVASCEFGVLGQSK